MKLEGRLETIALRELIEMIAYSSVTGTLTIYADPTAGHIYFRDGHLYHCDSGNRIGVDGLASLFELSQATFSFVSDTTSDQESLWGDIDYHLQSAEHLAQRWKGVRPTITSLDMIPALLIPLESAMRRLGPSHHQILDRIDGLHTINAIADDLGWALIDVAEAIAQMSHNGLVELRHSAQTPSSEPAIPVRGGFFNRLLSRSIEVPQQISVEHQVPSAEDLVLRAIRS